MVKALAFAKINLYLAVIGRRADGYHEIETIFQSIDLADELAFEPADQIEVVCSVPELSGERNLAHSAAEHLRAAAAISQGARITITKHVPTAAGLGGGSADAAATLAALNRMWRLGWPVQRLAEVGARVGSDVPFCVSGGTAFGRGRGTELFEMTILKDCPIVIAKPAGGLLARDVYAAYDEAPAQPKRPAEALRALLDVADVDGVCPLLENTLEPAVLRLKPEVAHIKQAALAAGARCVLVSGSGPAVFAVTGSREKANAVAAALESTCDFVHTCIPVDHGVEVFEV